MTTIVVVNMYSSSLSILLFLCMKIENPWKDYVVIYLLSVGELIVGTA